MNYKLKTGKKYIALVSTESACWDVDSQELMKVLEEKGILIERVIPINQLDETFKFIEIEESK